MMDLAREYPIQSQGLLFPMMLIAAIAVIVFSIAGIATITGWMPHALIGEATMQPANGVAASSADVIDGQNTGPMFQCVECGVIDSVREIERRSLAKSAPLASASAHISTARRPSL